MTGQRRKQAQMGEHSRMNRTEFMRQLESLLQNISATEREEALQYYNEYFNDAGPENEQNVIEALGNPAKVAENIKKDIFGNGYGENIYQKILQVLNKIKSGENEGAIARYYSMVCWVESKVV